MCTELDNLIDCVKEAESSLYSKVPQSEIENMKDRIRELEIIEKCIKIDEGEYICIVDE